ncbi:mannosyl-oligosaccharide 1,2-alpha-mannosidase MNS1 [Colletotrichum spaethianum]|uniref:alpha-1,2-Mannosidase n=1 Tax=Colletotrichum spaethianum TaxID=700344 RepID=A0AA37LAX9_9PEZI|nr:mannosyl-oligosaccharide 1,2-alpha-mannosidase MNS1 [Colletotrichum spaethianum]GKT45016.1 mannosyl-oligosaccharide 1,2-alpha-mannosidase MNS1 [Colletotrichum spaethianum]
MILARRPPRFALIVALTCAALLLLYNPYRLSPSTPAPAPALLQHNVQFRPSSFNWSTAKLFYPVSTPLTPLPTGKPLNLPSVQHDFGAKNPHPEAPKRQKAVRDVFKKSYGSYKRYAWTRDELTPVSLSGKDTFGGWAASLVDSLNTLWIMGFRNEFYTAAEVAAQLDWAKTTKQSANMFKTTIRHLGGLLSAYDLSSEVTLLEKAKELGDMLYMGFNTPNRIPGFWINFKDAKKGSQLASAHDPSASPYSLSLKFTQLSQLTSNIKYFNTINHISRFLERTQYQSRLPGI